MSEDQIYAAIKEILREELTIDVEGAGPDVNLRRDLGLDSLDLATLTMALEERLGISIADADLQDVETIGQAVALVSAHMSSGA